MTEQYDSVVAQHYSAYRPPLHGQILAQALDTNEKFSIGVDIGCGTGYSTIVLANYCDHVFGVDPSQSMLADAAKHPRVTYFRGKADDLSVVPSRPVNVVTFAGSLYYTKTNKLRLELGKVCGPGAVIIAYDFEVLLDEVLANLKMDIPAVDSDYDHSANIVDWEEYSVKMLDTGQLRLELCSQELAHVLLADSNRLGRFSERAASRDPFEAVVKSLEEGSDKHYLNVNIYFARYEYSPG